MLSSQRCFVAINWDLLGRRRGPLTMLCINPECEVRSMERNCGTFWLSKQIVHGHLFPRVEILIRFSNLYSTSGSLSTAPF